MDVHERIERDVVIGFLAVVIIDLVQNGQVRPRRGVRRICPAGGSRAGMLHVIQTGLDIAGALQFFKETVQQLLLLLQGGIGGEIAVDVPLPLAADLGSFGRRR